MMPLRTIGLRECRSVRCPRQFAPRARVGQFGGNEPGLVARRTTPVCRRRARELQRLAREDGRTVARLTAHDGMVLALAVSPDGRLLASGGMDRRVKLWRTADGRALGGLPLMRARSKRSSSPGRPGARRHRRWRTQALGHGERIGAGAGAGQARPVDGPKLVGLAFSPDSATVAAIGSGGGIGLYDVLGMRQRRHLDLQPGDLGARTLSYSPSGRLLAAAGDGRRARMADGKRRVAAGS